MGIVLATLVLLAFALLSGLARWAESLREEQCNRFSRTHARIEAAERGEDQARRGREGQDGCVGHVSFVAPPSLSTPLNSVAS